MQIAGVFVGCLLEPPTESCPALFYCFPGCYVTLHMMQKMSGLTLHACPWRGAAWHCTSLATFCHPCCFLCRSINVFFLIWWGLGQYKFVGHLFELLLFVGYMFYRGETSPLRIPPDKSSAINWFNSLHASWLFWGNCSWSRNIISKTAVLFFNIFTLDEWINAAMTISYICLWTVRKSY